jgi:hypothetical protein
MSTTKAARLVVTVSLMIFAFAPTTALPRTRSPFKLAVRLLLPNPRSCLGDKHIPAEIALRNMSDKLIIVPLSGIGSGIHYRAFSTGDVHSPGLQTLDLMSDPWPTQSQPSKQVNLSPGESYWVDGRLVLNHEFFSTPGVFAVSVDFTPSRQDAAQNVFQGALQSNWVYFEIEECHDPGSRQKPPIRPHNPL